MMTFREFLLLESPGFNHSGNLFYKLQLYPSDAGDYVYATSQPVELSFLQHLWKAENKSGRKFINIDEPKFQKVKYVSVKSNLPDGKWGNESDRGVGKPVYYDKPFSYAVGRNSKDVREMKKDNKQVNLRLDGLFGDKGSNSVQNMADNGRWKR